MHVISLGGVLDSDPGLRVVARMDHLVGDKDIMEKHRPHRVSRPLAHRPRLGLERGAQQRRGRGEACCPGMAHNTPGGYMDPNARTLSRPAASRSSPPRPSPDVAERLSTADIA